MIDQQVLRAKPLSISDQFLARTSRSGRLAREARALMPDGISTDTRAFEPYGIYVERAKGVRKWDVDGNAYLDFFGGHGALMLGHCHHKVTQAIQSAAGNGIQFAANSPQEVAWASQISRNIRSAQRVRFVGSGTEATMLAIRIARAFSGRQKLVRIATHYHGWHDLAVSGYASHFDGTAAPGVLPAVAANTILVRPGDREGLKAALTASRDEICAVLIEPLGSHFGIVPVEDDFVRFAFELAKQNGILTILDEVISGFRVAPGGMQELLDVEPDLTCLAKVAAGGMPGGAVCGLEEPMSVLSRKRPDGSLNPRKITHMGTFTGNPVTASAATATIREIVEHDLCAVASSLGERARLQLNDMFRRRGLRWLAYGRFSAFHILTHVPGDGNIWDTDDLPMEAFISRSPQLLQQLRMALNLEGVDIGSRGTAFVSAVHEPSDIDELCEAFGNALDRLHADRII